MPEERINISKNLTIARIGLDMDHSVNQIDTGKLTYALNASLESFLGDAVNYQNEMGNELCFEFPEGCVVVGKYSIPEESRHIFFLLNESTGISEIGWTFNDCKYVTYISSECLNFNRLHPIQDVVHRQNGCSTEIYWTDNFNPRRFLDLQTPPYKEGTQEIDCNLLNVQPKFLIPELQIETVNSEGSITSGTYQFAIQYANGNGQAYTSFYSVTNPCPIFDPNKITLDYNYPVGKSINVKISNVDTSGFYDYFNLAVIKTVNNITSVELVGTYEIDKKEYLITYTGQNQTNIQLSINDIFQKYPYYEKAEGLTTAQDILIWYGLTTQERLSYQKIANKISLKWQTWRIPVSETYKEEINSVDLRGYMRDEVYPFEFVVLLDNGVESDGFHIPGRTATPQDLELIFNKDVIQEDGTVCDNPSIAQPRWKVYNTGSLSSFEEQWLNSKKDNCYRGAYQFGEFSYWESSETYPANQEIWGELAGKPIRHHKFPDSSITHIHDSEGNIYPIGVKIDVDQIKSLIQTSDLSEDQKAKIIGFKIVRGNRANNKSVIAKGLINNVASYTKDDSTYYFPNYPYNDNNDQDPFLRDTNYSKLDRYTFHSPDTHFYQPFLGNILKLETAEYGEAQGHFVQVKNHAKYKLIAGYSYYLSLQVAIAIGVGNAVLVFNSPFGDPVNAFKLMFDLIEKSIPRVNYAYQYNSVGNYNNYASVANNGNKQRFLDIALYTRPGFINTGDDQSLNNWNRESSIYLKTNDTLPVTDSIFNVPQDNSRSGIGVCDVNVTTDVSSYYASIKQTFINQYGQIYSYETIDTGSQVIFNTFTSRYLSVFGGDTYINKFALKIKLPFFTDNRVGWPDESDIYYDEIGNVGKPRYFISSEVGFGGVEIGGGIFSGILDTLNKILGIKKEKLACAPGFFENLFYKKGKFFLFAYGIPYFYCESQVNVDYRQAYNDKEGDFYPRVSQGIPDDWLQEINVPITFDNTYTYNTTYSKQNKENSYTHLPRDYSQEKCRTVFPYRAVFSEARIDTPESGQRNNWLIYRPASYFDFAQNYGKLIALNGIEYKQVLARFENKTQVYNALLTAPTSQASIYLGQSLFSQQVPPIDLADTDLGYVGSQNKFLLKTEFGVISADAKRGQVFLIAGNRAKDLTDAASGVQHFFTEKLPFKILKQFPDIDIDNNFLNIGLHGVYDTKFNRFVLTKLDYECLDSTITYKEGKFYKDSSEVKLSDSTYFCNTSFSVSFDFETQSWVSFHSYLPNYYVGEQSFFYSGLPNSFWRHQTNPTIYNTYYGNIHPYILEYPFAYQFNDEILQNVKDYTKVFKYNELEEFVETDDVYFNKAILYNGQQCSGILKLAKKPRGNMNEYMKYPIYDVDSKTILFTKADNFYQYNTFWSLVKDKKQPIFLKSCESLSIQKAINQSNMDYSKRSFKKEPLRAKELRVQHRLDNRGDHKLVSQFLIAQSQISYR